ncbi:MAG: ATP-dependent zinc metalloprotease FtsH [Clostridia bacterium]|nr:ATP-dependent zinc metalloprotease FtsH [Clostridia bacterium]
MKNNLKVILFYVVFIALIAVVVVFMFGGSGAKQEIIDVEDYQEVIKTFADTADTNGDGVADTGVKSCTISFKHNTLTYTTYEGKIFRYKIADMDYFQRDLGPKIVALSEQGLIEEVINQPVIVLPGWVSILPFALIIIVFIVFYFIAMKRASSEGNKINSFGKARVKTPKPDEKNKVLFKDVAGADEEKQELQEIVEFLKAPGKFSRLGAKIPHGVLLMGPPGTGKTLLAKAVAGEAGVPFFSISGSDFVEMYVGVGASRVRDLFENARKAPASIIFIDEIDAVGRHRGAGLGGGHDEREQTLNQLLVEMDGFGSHEGIIVIAATNRPDILDPALLRPGRFDRQITVNYPDLQGREDILKVHAKNKPLEESVDLARVARSTVGFTGADLANLLNEAALLAARRNKQLVGMEEIDDAYLRIITGPQKKSRKIKESELRNTAYHEAGHAIVGHVLPHIDPVQLISVIPSGNALGYTLNPPTEDKFSVYREELKQEIAMLLGGRAAEMMINGDFSGGASNDIQRATNIARRMVTELGMSDVLGPIHYGSSESGEVFLGRSISGSPNHSGKTAAVIDEEISKIITEAFEQAKTILAENIDKLHFIADFLVKHEVMDGEQFAALMDRGATEQELIEIAEERARKSREANEQREKAEQERARREAEAKANENPFPYAQPLDQDQGDQDGQ